MLIIIGIILAFIILFMYSACVVSKRCTKDEHKGDDDYEL